MGEVTTPITPVVFGKMPSMFAATLDTDASGNLSVIFPDGMFASAPIVSAIPVSGAESDQYQVELVGLPTTTGCVIKLRKFVGLSVLGILGTINLFVASPGVRPVHVIALLKND